MTKEGRLSFDLPCWSKLSSLCRDLIIKMMAKDPERRISLDDALKHPWFDI